MSPWPLHLGNGTNLHAIWITVAQKEAQGKASLGTKSELAQQDPPHCDPRMDLASTLVHSSWQLWL